MAPGAGLGALNPTKPVTVSDFMSAIAPPGLKPDSSGALFDVGAGEFTRAGASGQFCTLGAAGYTEVVDDIIIEVVEAVSAGNTVDISVGVSNDEDAEVDDNYFLTGGATDVQLLPAHTVGSVFSILRGNLPNSAETWQATANTEALRTFGRGAVDNDGAAVAARRVPLRMCLVTTNAAGISAGKIRVYVRTHYTAVNFGPGL